MFHPGSGTNLSRPCREDICKSVRNRDVIAPREDTDGDHAECVLTRTSTITAGSCIKRTRCLSVEESEFYAGVKGVLILLEAKSMMTIDFGIDVKQCVCQAQKSSLVKRVMERLVLLIQGRVESGESRTEKWRGKCFRRKHVKMLQWSDAKDVVGQSFLQWCCGLSTAMRASSRGKIERGSEASCEVMEKQDAHVCIRLKGHYPRIHYMRRRQLRHRRRER